MTKPPPLHARKPARRRRKGGFFGWVLTAGLIAALVTVTLVIFYYKFRADFISLDVVRNMPEGVDPL